MRRADVWIAAIDALVVLVLGVTLLLVGILYGVADEHASLAERGYPVVLLWGGIQLAAIAISEATGRFVFWWLEPHAARATRRQRSETAVAEHGALRSVTNRHGQGAKQQVSAPMRY